ncbi:FMN-binding negative transcriptional regulator [uncultured Sphingomonas sp.]|uniref:FMN-binding negative transcriptional regulator n=1 Tax=uncultured Sphingomonas sp. TaxID=158754 RepID=UPI0025D4E443|nr:FMN-binding negative transcriptional regulator [uncultured Sphingomonas sp.]
MYRPPAFREDRPDILHALIRSYPLGTLITCGSAGLMANLLPFTLAVAQGGTRLLAHLAKANEQVAQLREGTPALILFHGPQGYVSPNWYPTKHAHGKAVPTWNYIAVEARGTPRILEDRDWLRDQLSGLTATHEQGRPAPWRLTDAPADFIEGQLRGIVGLEIAVDQLTGKWKVSQNQPPENRAGVERALRADGNAALADEVGTGPRA